MSNWGALTDHFGILAIDHGATTLDSVLKLISSNATPIAKSRSVAPDENGDAAAATWFGAPDTMLEVSCEFEAIGDFTTDLIELGEVTTGKVITGLELGTDSGSWPKLTFSGRIGCLTIVAPTGKLNT